MHPNQIFHGATRAENIAFARERAFGTLAVCVDGRPAMAQVPLLLDDSGEFVEFHLARNNLIARKTRSASPAVVSIQGPDSYISPDWYGIDGMVPTWNYISIEISGEIEPVSGDHLIDYLDRQSMLFEERLSPKTPWTMDKLSDEKTNMLLRMITMFRMRVEDIHGTWKLSQNRDHSSREAAAAKVAGHGFGADPRVLAAMMFAPPYPVSDQEEPPQ